MRNMPFRLIVTLMLVIVATACAPSPIPVPAPSTAQQPTAASAATLAPVATTQPTTVAEPTGAAGAPTELVLSIWGGPHEKVLKPILEKFEKENNVKIVYLFNSVSDRLTKLNAEKGDPTIDVAVIPLDEVPGLVRDEVVMPTNENIPNYDKLVENARIKGGYGISQLLFVLGYNTEKITEKPTSWEDLGKPEYRGHVAIGVVPSASGYSLLTMLAMIGGGSESNLQPAFDKLKEWRPFKAFISFFPALEPQIQSGDIWIFVDNAGLIQDLKDRGGPVELVVPEEGGVLGMNVAVIPQGVKNQELAEKLVGTLIGEEVQRSYAEALYYAPVNSTVELAPELAAKIHPDPQDKVIIIDMEALTLQKEQILEQFNKDVVGR